MRIELKLYKKIKKKKYPFRESTSQGVYQKGPTPPQKTEKEAAEMWAPFDRLPKK